MMSFLDILFLIVSLGIIGFYTFRGFFRNLAHTLHAILAVICAYVFGGLLGALLQKLIVGPAVYGIVEGSIQKVVEQGEQSLAEAILSVTPGFLQTEGFVAKINALQITDEGWLTETATSISTPIASLISNVVCYLAVFVLSWFLLRIVVKLVDKLIKKSDKLKTLNLILGAVWGILVALILGIVLASLLRTFFPASPIYTQSVILRFFGEAAFFRWFKIFDIGALLLGGIPV
ncbi:MAG: CvpA family protein [Clostridia bacterium]|nr:CvpA family protein [Clostridia bacterium]